MLHLTFFEPRGGRLTKRKRRRGRTTYFHRVFTGHDKVTDCRRLWLGERLGTVVGLVTRISGSTLTTPMIAPVSVGIDAFAADPLVVGTGLAPQSVFGMTVFVPVKYES